MLAALCVTAPLASCASGSSATAQADATRIHGELALGDASFASGQRADFYTFPVQAGCTYQIDLHSQDFDTFLSVTLADGSVVENDDFEQDLTHSQVTFTASQEGVLRVGVSHFGDDDITGRYALEVVQLARLPLQVVPMPQAAGSAAPVSPMLDAFDAEVVDGAMVNSDARAGVDGQFPLAWFFGEEPAFRAFEGQPLPYLDLAAYAWHDGQALTQEQLAGRVVVVDMWATWCGPCRAAMPHAQALAAQYGDRVQFLALCLSGEQDQMESILRGAGVRFPAAFLNRSQAQALESHGWLVQFFPTYHVIGADGRVVAAGVAPNHLHEVLDVVLAGAPSR